MVALDTDVLVLAYAFHRDARQADNAEFLARVQPLGPAVTIYTVMELLGKLSFSLPADRLAQWPSWLQDRWSLTILSPATSGREAGAFFQLELVERPLARMQRHKMAFLDSLILGLVEATPEVETFVTWNARHFQGKTHLAVRTPAEFVAG